MVEGHGGQGDVGVGGLAVTVTVTAGSRHGDHCVMYLVADHLGCKQTTEEWVADLGELRSPKRDSAGRGDGAGPGLLAARTLLAAEAWNRRRL